jgi:hypothetical protein
MPYNLTINLLLLETNLLSKLSLGNFKSSYNHTYTFPSIEEVE